MKETLDLALAPDQEGRLVLHRADCLLVRAQAHAGVLVVTLLDCQKMPDATHRHE